jgi:hypothetical protein
MLAVVKPSPLRLWGFLLTVVGGALMAFGSVGDWAAVSLGGSTENAVPTKGIDLWQGKVTVLIGVVIIVGILALRFVRPERRNLLAAGIVVLGVIGFAIALWCVIALDSVVRDTGIDALVDLVVTQLGLTPAEARSQVLAALGTSGVEVQAQLSLWLTLAGSLLAVAGGFVDLAWVRHKRDAGDAIDPDTLAARTPEAAPETGTDVETDATPDV